MITLIYSPNDWFASEVVYKALIRSFAKNQVQRFFEKDIQTKNLTTPGIFVLINPKNISLKSLPEQSKIILLGKIDETLAHELNITLLSEHPFSWQSHLQFHSLAHFEFPITERPFIRFDFPNEWNNLGFGAIQSDESIWAISQPAKSNDAIATIDQAFAFITLHDFANKSVIWINRAVGLVDSVNWHFIEYFVSQYRHEHLITHAYLVDIPANTKAAVTMRLDCDEDILSAQPLFEFYQHQKIPFSLAIKTSLPCTEADKTFLHAIQKNGGAILSHSVNHKVSWGENYYDAFSEAHLSKMHLENHFEITPLLFAVSPFHSNTAYSVKAMEDANYAGFIGGIIANDPEYLLARGGHVPFAEKIISHSQQCMLHGDCLLKDTVDPIYIYKKAFNQAQKSKTFFGYLDHPFSPRYQYGWKTEAQRIQAHSDFIQYMRSQTDVLFVNEIQCLQFMRDKSNAEIHYNNANIPFVQLTAERQSEFGISISMNNEVF